jgi:hypothetical protein
MDGDSRAVHGGEEQSRRYTALPVIRLRIKGPHQAGLRALDLGAQPVELEHRTYKVTVLLWVDRTNAHRRRAAISQY